MDALIQRNNASVMSRPEEKRTIEWWAKHFDADVHERFNFQSPVLDVGCGTGEKDVLFARAGLEVFGFDAGEFCIEIANKHRKKELPEVGERLQFCLADAREKWPYSDGVFSTVFSSDVLEHLPTECNAHFFNEVRRMLKPGGIFLIILPEGTAFDDPTHLQRFNVGSARQLIKDFANVQTIVMSQRIHLWGQV